MVTGMHSIVAKIVDMIAKMLMLNA